MAFLLTILKFFWSSDSTFLHLHFQMRILVWKWRLRKVRMRLQKIVNYIVGLILLCCCQSWLASLLCPYSATLAKFDTIPSCSGSLSLYAALEKFPFAQSACFCLASLRLIHPMCDARRAAVNLSTPDPAQCNLLFLFFARFLWILTFQNSFETDCYSLLPSKFKVIFELSRRTTSQKFQGEQFISWH